MFGTLQLNKDDEQQKNVLDHFQDKKLLHLFFFYMKNNNKNKNTILKYIL